MLILAATVVFIVVFRTWVRRKAKTVPADAWGLRNMHAERRVSFVPLGHCLDSNGLPVLVAEIGPGDEPDEDEYPEDD